MATRQITYTGTIPVDQPTLGLHWEPGQTQEVDAELADLWTADAGSAFSGPRTKDAVQARAAATTPAPATDEQPAPAPAGGNG